MLISAHEEQLASVTSLCKQEMKLLLGAKAGHKVSRGLVTKWEKVKYQDIPATCTSKLVIVLCHLISMCMCFECCIVINGCNQTIHRQLELSAGFCLSFDLLIISIPFSFYLHVPTSNRLDDRRKTTINFNVPFDILSISLNPLIS